MIDVNEENFEQEVLNSDVPVVVDFWAAWCGPCKALSPMLEQVATSNGDKIKVVKVNVDDNSDLTLKYGVRGIPTLMAFKDGLVLSSSTGFKGKTQLEAMFKEVLAE